MSQHTSIEVTTELLREWRLPEPTENGDKEDRGRVLVIGGSREMPGAVILSAMAAMRAGAGKLTVATGASVAQLVAQALPEARVIGLRETDQGGIRDGEVAQLPEEADAIVVGPGMQDEEAAARFASDAIDRFADACIVLDAFAMSALTSSTKSREQRTIIATPHAGEMAHLSKMSKEAVRADPEAIARKYATEWRVIVALKGAKTFIADPAGELWRHERGSVGLGTSGSGDVLAGVIAGLAARGASPAQATVWGVSLHARAGEALAARIGSLGYLAREIPGEIPKIMQALCSED
jgi:ADP-dependent NAD(P)H-hydrate dehydratase